MVVVTPNLSIYSNNTRGGAGIEWGRHGDSMNFIDLHAHFPMHLIFRHGAPKTSWPDDIKALELGLQPVVELPARLAAAAARDARCGARGGVSGFLSCLYDPDDEFLPASRTAPRGCPEPVCPTCAGRAGSRQRRSSPAWPVRAAELRALPRRAVLAVIHSVEGARVAVEIPAMSPGLRKEESLT